MTLKRKINRTKEIFLESWCDFKSLRIEKYSFLVCCIFLLSILDALFTLAWIKTGLAVEANPVLVVFLEMGDGVFLGFKILLTFMGCVILYMNRKNKLGALMISSLAIAYTGLTIYHFLGAWGSLYPENIPMFIEKVLITLS
jgi:hypothetical protein